MFLNKLSNVTYFSIAIAINQPKPLNFIIDSLCCELAEIVDGFEIGGCYACIGIDVEEIDDGDEQALA